MKRRESYVMVDNRVSGGQLLELAAFNCPHCNRTVIKNPQRVRPRNYCQRCDRNVCDNAGCIQECNPTELMVELAQQYPGEPFLLRGPNGQPLFNPDLKDRRKVY